HRRRRGAGPLGGVRELPRRLHGVAAAMVLGLHGVAAAAGSLVLPGGLLRRGQVERAGERRRVVRLADRPAAARAADADRGVAVARVVLLRGRRRRGALVGRRLLVGGLDGRAGRAAPAAALGLLRGLLRLGRVAGGGQRRRAVGLAHIA